MKPAADTKVLVVEDDPGILRTVADNLRFEKYDVVTAADGETGFVVQQQQQPDLIVLDLMLPRMSGLELCRKLRAEDVQVPVLVLTARSEEADRVGGLDMGADDYVVKPFSVPELMARVRALLRRSRPERIAERLCAGDLDLDREMRRVRRGSRDIHLGPTEFRLLEYLLEKPGRVFSRAQLLDGVWGQAAEIDERTVDVHVGRLRKALSRGRERDPIRTVRGTGYAFDETFGRS